MTIEINRSGIRPCKSSRLEYMVTCGSCQEAVSPVVGLILKRSAAPSVIAYKLSDFDRASKAALRHENIYGEDHQIVISEIVWGVGEALLH